MFLGFPNEILEEKPSFLDFENNWLRTDGPIDGRTDRPSYRDARTHLKTADVGNTKFTVDPVIHVTCEKTSHHVKDVMIGNRLPESVI